MMSYAVRAYETTRADVQGFSADHELRGLGVPDDPRWPSSADGRPPKVGYLALWRVSAHATHGIRQP